MVLIMQEQSGGSNSKALHSQRTTKTPVKLPPWPSPPAGLAFSEPSPQCPQHLQPLTFCCFECRQMVCCPRCLSRHRNHDIKNLHRSYVLVETSLSEYLVQLGAKIDLYSLYHEKLSISKSETIEDFGEVQRRVLEEFKKISQELERKQKEVMALVNTQSTLREQHINTMLTDLREDILVCMESHSLIQRHIKELNEISLCKFYAEKKEFIEGLVKGMELPPQQRQQITLRISGVEGIIQSIREMKPSCVLARRRVGRGSVDLRISSSNGTYGSKYRHPRESMPNTPISQTPKAQPSPPTLNKLSPQFRKSPKMFSMPSSPHKDKREPSPPSPLHYLQLQKRSFILGKQPRN